MKSKNSDWKRFLKGREGSTLIVEPSIDNLEGLQRELGLIHSLAILEAKVPYIKREFDVYGELPNHKVKMLLAFKKAQNRKDFSSVVRVDSSLPEDEASRKAILRVMRDIGEPEAVIFVKAESEELLHLEELGMKLLFEDDSVFVLTRTKKSFIQKSYMRNRYRNTGLEVEANSAII